MNTTPQNTNGSRPWQWLASLLIPTLFGGSLAWVTTMYKNVQSHSETLAVLQAQMHDTRDELQRINQKLDRLLLEHRK